MGFALFLCQYGFALKNKKKKLYINCQQMTETNSNIVERAKSNFNVSFSASTNKLGIDTCIRDEEGCFVLCQNYVVHRLCSVGETLSLYRVIRWIQ